jgi:hypothetical protein
LCALKLSAINNVGPLDQILQSAGVESEMLLQHFDDEFSAGLIRGIVEFPPAPVCPEMGFIFGAEERALVMIKPPAQARITGIFKIHDGILIAVKLDIQKKLAGAMRQALIDKLRVFVDCAQIEVAENGCGCQTIEAIIVKVNLHLSHRVLDLKFFHKQPTSGQRAAKRIEHTTILSRIIQFSLNSGV